MTSLCGKYELSRRDVPEIARYVLRVKKWHHADTVLER